VKKIIEQYKEVYPELESMSEMIVATFNKEEQAFSKTYDSGIREFERIIKNAEGVISGADAFLLSATYGFPLELTQELASKQNKNIDIEEYKKEVDKHRELSKAGAQKKFGGHGLILDTGELKAANEEELKIVTRLHTTTHLIHQALRMVLGESVHQSGSDITPERTRFDFTFERKVTSEELKKIEDIVNDVVARDLPVQKKVLPKGEAEKTGALFFFKEKYPDPVNVYFVGNSLEDAFSKEFCGGPHVTHTGEIGKIKIIKEEAVASGVRRLRATVEGK
jgi:alanyl-tRNA synthetase